MNRIKSVVIIGAGAIGAAYAARIYDYEPELLKILADKNRIDRYNSQGFVVNGKRYDFNYCTTKDITEPIDLIIVAVKNNQLSEVIKDMETLVGDNTLILSLLNGVDSEEVIGSVYGREKVLYSICVSIDAVRKENNINYSSIGQIHFGELDNKVYSERVKLVKEFFDRTHIPYIIPEDMMHTLWWKFMINVGVNQTSAILRAPYKFFQKYQEFRDIMEGAMKEVIMVSQKVGANLKEEEITEWHNILQKMGPENKTSMLQDIEAGRKTEVDVFGVRVCELGKKYGVPTPVNETLVRFIKALEKTIG